MLVYAMHLILILPTDMKTLFFSFVIVIKLYNFNHLQSNLGYPATSGPTSIQIQNLAGYERLRVNMLKVSKAYVIMYSGNSI